MGRAKLTRGVVTGTIFRWNRVCTTGALRPLMAWGRESKSEVRRRWAGKNFSRTSKNCISLVGMNSACDRLAAKGILVDMYRRTGFEG